MSGRPELRCLASACWGTTCKERGKQIRHQNSAQRDFCILLRLLPTIFQQKFLVASCHDQLYLCMASSTSEKAHKVQIQQPKFTSSPVPRMKHWNIPHWNCSLLTSCATHITIHIHVHYCWHSWQRGSWNTLKCFTSTGRWRNGEETISAIRSQGASIEGKPCDSGNVVETSTYWLDLPKCCDYFSDSTMLNHISCCFHVARTCCLHLLPLYFKQFGEDGEILAKPMSMEEMSSWVCPATCDGWLQFLCVLLYCFMALLMHW